MVQNRRFKQGGSNKRLKQGMRSMPLKEGRSSTRSRHGGIYGKKHIGKRYSSTKNEINHVNPASRSMERPQEYSRRRAQQDFTQQRIKQQRKRRNIIIAICAVIALGISIIVAVFAFGQAVDSKLHSGIDAELKAALVAPKKDSDPYYTLYVGLDDAASESIDGVGGVVLMRTDPSTSLMTLVSVPPDTRVAPQSGGYKRLGTIYKEGGAVALVKMVSALCDVDMAHYVEVDFSSLPLAVDKLGGVDAIVDEAFYDAEYGAGLNAGLQTLNGQSALLYCRSTKPFVEGSYACAAHQRLVLLAAFTKMATLSDRSLKISLDTIGDCVSTDLDTDEIVRFLELVRGRDYDQSVYSGIIPGERMTVGGIEYTIANSSGLSACIKRVDQGLPPDEKEAAAVAAGKDPVSAVTVDPTLFSVEVRNGAGVEGCATEAAAILKQAGYNVTAIGNASSYVYEETLVVYNNDEYENAAKSAAHVMGCGRAIASNGAYTFTTRLLVVVGGDWIPRH